MIEVLRANAGSLKNSDGETAFIANDDFSVIIDPL
jgi:hypothetical protein